MNFDVRDNNTEPVSVITFADADDMSGVFATNIQKSNGDHDYIEIYDSCGDYIQIKSIEHVKNLKLALDKAISLGWIK